jgi:N-acetylglucosaminyldiphosphoundecaprenol N-acetyl-beta-D-mannosaminyltransferase
MARVELLGVSIDALTFAEAVDAAMRLAGGEGPKNIITVNPEMLQAAQYDVELARCLAGADLKVADGVGVVWASKKLRAPLPERVTGIDLMAKMIERCAAAGVSVYLLGGKPGVAALAADKLLTRHPSLVISGVMHGYFSKDEEGGVISAIRQARPSVLFVGMGVPAQEKWIEAHKKELGVPLMMGVGGSFDVIAGKVTRAPEIFQKLGIEWLFRLLSQPSRLRRQLVLVSFAARVLREKRKTEGHGGMKDA